MKLKYVALLIISAVLLLFSTNQAQSGGNLNDRLANLKAELELQPEQFKKVAKLLVEMDMKAEEKADEFSSDEEGLREAIGKIRKRTDRGMKKILTNEQFVKYQELQAKGRMKEPGDLIDQIDNRLALTEDQRADIRPIVYAYLQKLGEQRKSMRDGNMDRSARREYFSKMREESGVMVKAVEKYLTEDQKLVFSQLMEDNRSKRRNRSGRGGPDGRDGQRDHDGRRGNQGYGSDN